MSEHCDHCGSEIDREEEWVGGSDGVYCSPICWYDAEVLGVDAGELAPETGRRVVEQ